jgi:hypothetical protein
LQFIKFTKAQFTTRSVVPQSHENSRPRSEHTSVEINRNGQPSHEKIREAETSATGAGRETREGA